MFGTNQSCENQQKDVHLSETASLKLLDSKLVNETLSNQILLLQDRNYCLEKALFIADEQNNQLRLRIFDLEAQLADNQPVPQFQTLNQTLQIPNQAQIVDNSIETSSLDHSLSTIPLQFEDTLPVIDSSTTAAEVLALKADITLLTTQAELDESRIMSLETHIFDLHKKISYLEDVPKGLNDRISQLTSSVEFYRNRYKVLHSKYVTLEQCIIATISIIGNGWRKLSPQTDIMITGERKKQETETDINDILRSLNEITIEETHLPKSSLTQVEISQRIRSMSQLITRYRDCMKEIRIEYEEMEQELHRVLSKRANHQPLAIEAPPICVESFKQKLGSWDSHEVTDLTDENALLRRQMMVQDKTILGLTQQNHDLIETSISQLHSLHQAERKLQVHVKNIQTLKQEDLSQDKYSELNLNYLQLKMRFEDALMTIYQANTTQLKLSGEIEIRKTREQSQKKKIGLLLSKMIQDQTIIGHYEAIIFG